MKLTQAFHPFRYAQFRYQYVGFAVSVIGNMLSLVALTVGLLQVTGSGATAGIALGASTVPLVVFILLGGVWADRLPRQHVMAAMDTVRAVTQLGVGAMLLSGHVSLPLLIVLQALFGTAQAFHLPAASGLTGATVPRDQIQRANTLLSFTRSVAGVVGPLLAGLLVATVGAGWALVLDGLTFVCSALFALRIELPRKEPRAGSSMLKELGEGFRLVRTTPWIWTSVVGFMCTHVAVAVFMVVGPVVALANGGGGAFSWAFVIAALGVGDVLGDLFLLRYQPRRPMLVARLAEILLVPALVLVAIGAPVAVQVIAVALAGAGMTAADSLWLTTMQHQVSDESLSKVSSYDWLSSVALRPVGYALGAIVSSGGVAVVLCSLAFLVAVSRLVSLAYPSVRQLRTPADALSN